MIEVCIHTAVSAKQDLNPNYIIVYNIIDLQQAPEHFAPYNDYTITTTQPLYWMNSDTSQNLEFSRSGALI